MESLKNLSLNELKNLVVTEKISLPEKAAKENLLGLFLTGGKTGTFGANYKLNCPLVAKNVARLHQRIINRCNKGIYSTTKIQFKAPDRFNLENKGFELLNESNLKRPEAIAFYIDNAEYLSSLAKFKTEYEKFVKAPKAYKFELLPE